MLSHRLLCGEENTAGCSLGRGLHGACGGKVQDSTEKSRNMQDRQPVPAVDEGSVGGVSACCEPSRPHVYVLCLGVGTNLTLCTCRFFSAAPPHGCRLHQNAACCVSPGGMHVCCPLGFSHSRRRLAVFSKLELVAVANRRLPHQGPALEV